MDFFELVKNRYSVRSFDAKPVPDELIEQILHAARLAPTAVNKQPWRILVVRGRTEMAKLAKCTKYTFKAPAAFIVGYDPEKAWVRPYDQENSGLIDACIVATYVMLAIHNLGLGSCWVGHFDPKAVLENFPVKFTPAALFPFGYPAADAKPAAYHEQRLPLAETVSYIGSF